MFNQITNNMKGKTTFMAKAFLMLFAVLFSFTEARAQQALPYEYGFENNDLAAEGWTTSYGGTANAADFGIIAAAAQTGSYGFRFSSYSRDNVTYDQYLISPELDAAAGVVVQFSYKASSTSGTETFKVGYSTTDTDPSSFTFGDEISTNSTAWTLSEEITFPAGTKYVAVYYYSNYQYRLYVDDFSFAAPSAIAKPTGLKVNYTGGTEATVSWSSEAPAFDIDVNDVVTENVSNPYALTGLSLRTTYTIKVRAKDGTNVSGWTTPVSFKTEYGVVSLPFTDGFEDGLDAWTLVDCASGSKIVSGSSYAHEGNYSFKFTYNSTPPQYLISPEFEGTSAMTVSFWYKIGSANYPETFQVGYSTTTKDVDEFTWGDEVEATNNAEWLQYDADFPAGTKYVAVRLNSNDKLALYLDDFSFTVNNGIAKPSGLKVDNITATSADLSWAENGTATVWQVCLNGDEANLIDVDSNPFTLTGLTPETAYTAKVRAVVGAESSNWSNEVSFTTPELYPKPTDLAVSEVSSKTAVLSWTENGTATAWEICLNDDETELITADSNPFTLSKLSPETAYTVKVRANYGKEDRSAWSAAVNFTTDVAFPAPADVVASNVTANSADVSWTGTGDKYNLRYREDAGINNNFENSSLGKWTTIDADGDGFCWEIASGLGNFSHHNDSEDCVTSGSYDSNAGALTPDNYLVSPLVTLGGSITFWACAQDASYAAEHFGVAVSTTGNTDPADFTTIQEWTMTSAGTPSSRRKAAGTWGEYTVDLSAYAGQQGYVAIRHFDCSDFFYLNIDDIVITEPVERPWMATIANATSPYTIEGLTPETDYEVEVQAIYSDGVSSWAGITFTTIEDVATPSDLAASDVTWDTAVLAWTENGEATAWEICLNGDEANLIAADSNPFTVTGLTEETRYTAKVRAVDGEKRSHWSDETAFTTDIRFHAPIDLAANNVTTNSAEISWNAEAAATGAVLEYASTGDVPYSVKEYKYDNGTRAGTVGLGGGAFQWGVMFPAGSYVGNILNKVSVYDAASMTGSVSIYSGGDTAPGTEIATQPITFTGAGAFVDVSFGGLAFDATQNLWVIVNNESGTAYPAATATDELGDANGRWVEINGTWYDLANAGVTGSCFMVRAEISTGIDLSTLSWTTVTDATSPYELTGLDSETNYVVRVKSVFADGESLWTTTAFATQSENPVPSNIAIDLAADGATLTWDGTGDSYNVQYRTAAAVGDAVFEDDFENGLDQWTIVTAGEGPGWVVGTETGTNAATAYSWQSGVGSYAADNWLISPAVELGGVLKFGVATASSYPDSYEVLLSTTGTETTDFTETLQAMAAATSGNVTIDLSAYTGTGYIAIHHVSNDCYLLAIDDFGVYEVVPAGAWQEMAVTEATATISGLATNNAYEYQIQSVKDANVSAWSDIADFALLTLADDADNTSLVNTFDGYQAHVTLAGRTLYQDNTWNTIYLPFDMTLDEVNASPLAGGDIRTLTDNIAVEGKSVTLNFTAAGEAIGMYAAQGYADYIGGLPYIVKWASGSNIDNPEFANVTISSSRYIAGDDAKAIFQGTYAPISFTAEEKSILFIGENNELNWPLAGATIGACRGYFELVGMEAEVNPNAVKVYTNLDDEDPTGISELSENSGNSEWYDLSGRKLAGKPGMKGIYVNGGRKVSVK